MAFLDKKHMLKPCLGSDGLWIATVGLDILSSSPVLRSGSLFYSTASGPFPRWWHVCRMEVHFRRRKVRPSQYTSVKLTKLPPSRKCGPFGDDGPVFAHRDAVGITPGPARPSPFLGVRHGGQAFQDPECPARRQEGSARPKPPTPRRAVRWSLLSLGIPRGTQPR